MKQCAQIGGTHQAEYVKVMQKDSLVKLRDKELTELRQTAAAAKETGNY